MSTVGSLGGGSTVFGTRAASPPSTTGGVGFGGGYPPAFGFPNLAPLVAALNFNAVATISNARAIGQDVVSRETGFTRQQLTSMQHTSNALGTAAAVGTAGMLGSVGLIDPSTLSTFTGSLKLLSAEIGTVFVPYIKAAAFAFQDWMVWFQNLDDGTKAFIGRMTVATIVTIGIGAVVTRIIPMVMGLGTAFANVGRALTLFTVTNPVIAGLVGIGAVIGTLVGVFSGLGGAARGAHRDVEGARIEEERMAASAAARALPADVATRMRAAGTHEQRMGVLREHRQQLLDEQRQIQERVGPELLAQQERTRRLFMPAFFGDRVTPAQDALTANRRRVEGIDRLMQQLGGRLEDFVSPVRARYTDAMAYRESVQLAALNVPQTEAQLALRQMEELNNNLGGQGPLIQAISNQTAVLSSLLLRLQVLAP